LDDICLVGFIIFINKYFLYFYFKNTQIYFTNIANHFLCKI